MNQQSSESVGDNLFSCPCSSNWGTIGPTNQSLFQTIFSAVLAPLHYFTPVVWSVVLSDKCSFEAIYVVFTTDNNQNYDQYGKQLMLRSRRSKQFWIELFVETVLNFFKQFSCLLKHFWICQNSFESSYLLNTQSLWKVQKWTGRRLKVESIKLIRMLSCSIYTHPTKGQRCNEINRPHWGEMNCSDENEALLQWH